MSPSVKRKVQQIAIRFLEAFVFIALSVLWLGYTISGESPTKFIYYNF